MTHKFPRMNSKQKEYCPSGYVWLTNYNIIGMYRLSVLSSEIDEYTVFTEFVSECREKYGDVAVTIGFDVLGRPLTNTDVAVYVLHPAVRRVKKTLKRLKARRIT